MPDARATWSVYAGASLAMVAFAANSLLTRSALDSASIDAATFTSVRLLSGAVTLTAILAVRVRRAPPVLARPAPWRTAAFLFAYAAAFSLAYLRIGAATGALVLFGTVQTVMYAAAIRRRERIGTSGRLHTKLRAVAAIGSLAARPASV
jgi:drug/metabolite transporter (DMT)-like permease